MSQGAGAVLSTIFNNTIYTYGDFQHFVSVGIRGVGRLRGFSACGIGCLTSYFAFQKALAASLQPQFERPQRDPGGHTSRTTRYAAID